MLSTKRATAARHFVIVFVNAVGAHLAGPGRIQAGLGRRLRDVDATAGAACTETEHMNQES
jgi:hypothetical protein